MAILNGFGSKDARARTDRLIGLLSDGEKPQKPVMYRGRELFQAQARSYSNEATAKPVGHRDRELNQFEAPATLRPGGEDPGQPRAADVPPTDRNLAPAAAGVAPAPIPAPAAVVPAPDSAPIPAPAVVVPAPGSAPAGVAPDPTPVPAPAAVVSDAAPIPARAAKVKDEGGDAPTQVMTWWFEGDDLILTDGLPRATGADAKPKPAEPAKAATDRVDAVLDAIEGEAPNASTHPGREAALAEGRGIDGFAPDGLVVIESAGGGDLLQDLMKRADVPAIPFVPIPKLAKAPTPDDEIAPEAADDKEAGPKDGLDELKALGLDRLKRVVGRWGFRGEALMTVVRFEIPAPRTGMLSLLDQPSLRADRLPPIPKDAGAFVVGSFDPAKGYDTFVGLLKTFDPDQAGEIDKAIAEVSKAVRDATGQRLREDLLGHLGPAWRLYTTRFEIRENAPTPVPALLVDVRDREAFGTVLDALVARVNDGLRGPKGADAKAGDEPPALVLERLPAPERGYRLVSPEGVVPWAGADIQPTVLLGESSMAVAMNPELARAAVAAESRQAARWEPGDELARTLAGLPAGVTSLSVGDVRDSSWPEAIATLPRTVQYLGNLLGASDAVAAAPAPGAAALAMLGVPAPGGFRIKIDPAKVPRAGQVRALLFPSVLATVVDDRGIRFIGAEALPFACIGSKVGGDAASKGDFKFDLNRLFNR